MGNFEAPLRENIVEENPNPKQSEELQKRFIKACKNLGTTDTAIISHWIEASVDQLERRHKILRLHQTFAEQAGWEKWDEIDSIEYNERNWGNLANIPGSFPETLIEKCHYEVGPSKGLNAVERSFNEAVYRAHLELLPSLLRKGHHGRRLVFGHGPKIWAVADTWAEAKEELKQLGPYQMPIRSFDIDPSHLENRENQQYLEWKRQRLMLETSLCFDYGDVLICDEAQRRNLGATPLKPNIDAGVSDHLHPSLWEAPVLKNDPNW